MLRVFLIAVVGLTLGACSSEKSAHAEARALLDRISALDPDASRAERRARLDALSGLQLSDPELARVRDRCFEAHGGLLQAELEQAAARQRLSALEGRDAAAPDVRAEALGVAEQIRRSDAALAAAKAPFEDCARHTRELTLRLR